MMTNSGTKWPSIPDVIDELWRKWTLDGKIETSNIANAQEFYESILEENKNCRIKSLDNNLLLYDELVNWSIALAMSLRSQLSVETNISPSLKACAIVAAAICSHIWSIRILVTSGHDLPAKQVLRSLSEHFDILNLLWLKPELCDEFMNSGSPEEANTFWHKHVSKGKLKNETENLLFNRANEEHAITDAVKFWREYRLEEEKILGMSVHPSSTACAMSALPAGVNPESNIPGFLGQISEMSIRTLQYAVHSSWEVILNRTFPFGDIKKGKSNGRRLIEFDAEDPFHATVASGSQVINEIILLHSKWQGNHPSLNGIYGNYPWPEDET